ncbi:hypothetical protein GPALN_005972, partial [Globodera pallida]
MDFAEWSLSVQIPIIYLTIFISIPSMALNIAQIVTIVRHKKFNNSFYALFVMRAIPDWFGVFVSLCCNWLPCIFSAALYPIYSKFPNWFLAMFYFLAGYTFQANFFATAFILLNRLTAIIMPIKHEKAPNSTTERSFFIFEAGDITDIWLVNDTKTRFMLGSYYPLIMDTGTVVLASWLLLWASGTFRQQLIKDLRSFAKQIFKIIVSVQWRGPETIIIGQLEE